MRYFLSAADDPIEKDYAELLEAHGYRVTETYDDDAVLLSLGGDGSILYNSRRYEEPTILPVAGPGSEANTIGGEHDRRRW
jgi:NAD kinase